MAISFREVQHRNQIPQMFGASLLDLVDG